MASESVGDTLGESSPSMPFSSRPLLGIWCSGQHQSSTTHHEAYHDRSDSPGDRRASWGYERLVQQERSYPDGDEAKHEEQGAGTQAVVHGLKWVHSCAFHDYARRVSDPIV